MFLMSSINLEAVRVKTSWRVVQEEKLLIASGQVLGNLMNIIKICERLMA